MLAINTRRNHPELWQAGEAHTSLTRIPAHGASFLPSQHRLELVTHRPPAQQVGQLAAWPKGTRSSTHTHLGSSFTGISPAARASQERAAGLPSESLPGLVIAARWPAPAFPITYPFLWR